MRRGASLIGQRFGRLIVLAEERNVIGLSQCLTRCRCGIKKLVYKSHLRSGKTRSCGCLRRKETLGVVPKKLVTFISIEDVPMESLFGKPAPPFKLRGEAGDSDVKDHTASLA